MFYRYMYLGIDTDGEKNLQTDKTYFIGYVFLILVPLLFGLLEFSWGSGAVTIVLLFIGWRQGICDI